MGWGKNWFKNLEYSLCITLKLDNQVINSTCQWTNWVGFDERTTLSQCRRKTFMVHQTFVWWALYIPYKFVKSPIRHLGLAIGNVQRFSPSLLSVEPWCWNAETCDQEHCAPTYRRMLLQWMEYLLLQLTVDGWTKTWRCWVILRVFPSIWSEKSMCFN